MSKKDTWKATIASSADDLLAKEQVATAIGAAKQAAKLSGQAVTKSVSKARNTVSQEEAWREISNTLEELVNVVRVQHAKLADLTERVEGLEGSTP